MTNTIVKKRNGMNYPETFGSVLDNIFQGKLLRFTDENFWNTEGYLSSANVPVNIRENERQYFVDIIAPGCRKEDFKIQVDNRELTVSHQKEEKHQNDEKTGWSRNQFVQSSFSKTFTLGEAVDTNNIEAVYNDGILRLSLAKNVKAGNISRTIEIK